MASCKISLSSLSAGQRAMISKIHVSDALRERLTALGFLEGTKIFCLGAGPSGDPVAYEVRRTVIALRRADCDGIEVLC